jgi:predicted aconitase
VLVKLGDCLYSQKLINAKAADVTGAVIYNNAFDIISFLPDTGPEAKVPFVGTG